MSQKIEIVNKSTVTLLDVMGDDYAIVEAAVVSTGQTDYPRERVDGLIRRLMSDRHGSPFEMVQLKFHVDTQLFTMRQIMRHRIASYNETSGRYRELEPRFYVPPSWRPIKKVPGSKAMDYETEHDEAVSHLVSTLLVDKCERDWELYQRYVELGVVREIARLALPVNIMTQAVISVNLRSLFNFLSLRSAQVGMFPSHPQYEITEVANRMENLVKTVVPSTWEAFVSARRVAP